jgi:hypothetical protein
MTTGIQDKKQFEPFSCCYTCGVPQAICRRWQEDEQGGFTEDKSIVCQYPRVVIPVVAVILRAWPSSDTDVIFEWMTADSVNMTVPGEQFGWFGRKVRWGGIEVSNLCRVFHKLVSMVDLELG